MKHLNQMVALGITLLAVESASATLLFEEGFNYTAGAGLGGNGAWTGGNNNIKIGNANLTYSGLADAANPGNDLTVTSGVSSGSVPGNFTATALTGGSIYYAFLAQCTTLPTGNNYITSLLPTGASGPNGSGDPLAVYVGQQTAGSQFKLGVRHGGSGAAYATGSWAALNTVNLFVVEYTFGSGGTVNLFVNPTPGGTQPVTPDATMSGGTDAANLQEIGFKAQSSAGAGNWVFDTLRVGDTWADVVPAAAVVPEPSTFALAGLGIFGLALWRRARR
jgi:hypothetical protein